MRAVAILLTLTFALTGPLSPASCGRGNSPEAAQKREASRPQQVENAPEQGDPFAAIPRIKVRELVKAVEEGRAVVVDIRVAEDYEEEHIKGAFSIPLEEVRERGPRELPADKLIVTYCA